MESTQTIARQLAHDGAAEGTVVVAREQTGGRGRLGNSFFSPPGGLYLSLLLRPTLAPSHTPLIGLVAGVALAQAIADVSGRESVLKWPNDVLLSGRKVCGILAEVVGGCTIVGVGVNANIPPATLPAGLRTTATSLLAESGRAVALDDLLSAILGRFERGYRQLLDKPESAVAEWRATPNVLGERVRVATHGRVLEGVAADLDADGALIVRIATGELCRCVAAEVHLLRG